MKKLLAIVLFLTLTLGLCACTGVAPDDKEPFTDFLSGKLPFINDKGEEAYITDFDFFGEETAYALYDMNGDSNPELLVNMSPELHTFTILDNQVKLWRSDTAYSSRPLNNSAILYEHHGGGPEHTYYTYYVPDFYGNTKYEISFSYWESDGENPEWYDINGKEVSKEAYEAITAPIFEIGDDKIDWALIENKNETLLSVLSDNQEFIINGSTKTLSELLNSVSGEAKKYTLIDLDNDVQDELVIEYFKEDFSYLIIDYAASNQKLYGYYIGFRSFNWLKSDSRFLSTGGPTRNSICNIHFFEGGQTVTTLAEWDDIEKIFEIDGTPVKKATVESYFQDFHSSPNATWMDIY